VTPLVALIVIVLVAVMAANLVGRARAGVRSVRSHHRALDTLGDITTRRPPPGAPSSPPAAFHQAHVRILAPEIELREPEVPIVVEVPEPEPVAVIVPFRLPPPPRNDLWDTGATNGHPVSPELTPVPSGDGEVEVTVEEDGDGEPSDDDAVAARAGDDDPGDDVIDLDGRDGDRSGEEEGEAAGPRSSPELPASIWPTAGDRAVTPAGRAGLLGTRGQRVGGGARTPLAVFGAAGSGVRTPAPGERSSRRRTAVASTAVLGVAAVGVFLVLHGHHRAPPPVATTVPAVTTEAPTPSTATTVAAKARTATVKRVPVRLISSRPGTALYRLAKGTRVTFTANSPCWMEVRHANSTGPIVATTILAAGASRSVTGPVWVRVGDPTAVAIRAAGVAVAPPAIKGQPYDLQFDD
jgi:hypothetical protein